MTIILVKVHQFVTNFELSAKEPFERGYTKRGYTSATSHYYPLWSTMTPCDPTYFHYVQLWPSMSYYDQIFPKLFYIDPKKKRYDFFIFLNLGFKSPFFGATLVQKPQSVLFQIKLGT